MLFQWDWFQRLAKASQEKPDIIKLVLKRTRTSDQTRVRLSLTSTLRDRSETFQVSIQ